MSVLDPAAIEGTKRLFEEPLREGETHAGRVLTILASNAAAESDSEAQAYAEYKAAARDLADVTAKMQAAQARFQAALQKLTAIVAPIPKVP